MSKSLRILISDAVLLLLSASSISAQDTAAPAAQLNPERIIAVIWIAVGLIMLITGWKLYKLLLASTGLILGLYAAYFIGEHFNASTTLRVMLVIAMALAGFFMARAFQKMLIFFLGGLGGAILVSTPIELMFQGEENALLSTVVGLALGFVIFGFLSLYFFRYVIIFSTSLIGSFYLMLGLKRVLSIGGFESGLLVWLDPADKGFAVFLIFTLIGNLIQHGINKVFPEDDDPSQKKPKAKPDSDDSDDDS